MARKQNKPQRQYRIVPHPKGLGVLAQEFEIDNFKNEHVYWERNASCEELAQTHINKRKAQLKKINQIDLGVMKFGAVYPINAGATKDEMRRLGLINFAG